MARLRLFSLLWTAGIVSLPHVQAQEAGDGIIVIAERAATLKRRGKGDIEILRGSVAMVRSVAAESLVIDWQGRIGTIGKQDVLALETRPNHSLPMP